MVAAWVGSIHSSVRKYIFFTVKYIHSQFSLSLPEFSEGGIKSNALNAGSNQALTSVVTSTGKIWSYLLGCVGWKAYSEVNDTEHEFSKSQQGAFLTKSLTSYLYASDFGENFIVQLENTNKYNEIRL